MDLEKCDISRLGEEKTLRCCVRKIRYLEELDVSVEEVTLGDMDVLGAELMHQAENSGGDDGFAAGRRVGEGPCRDAVFEHDAVQLPHVQLVAFGTGGDGVAKAPAAENGLGYTPDCCLDLVQDCLRSHVHHLCSQDLGFLRLASCAGCGWILEES